MRTSMSPKYHFTETTCQLSEYVPVIETDSPKVLVMFSAPSICATGGDRSWMLISWNFVAGLPSIPITRRCIVRSAGSFQVFSTDIPAASLKPSPSRSQRYPSEVIWPDRFGVVLASKVTVWPTSTTASNSESVILGSNIGVRVTVTVVAIDDVPTPPPPALLSSTTYKSAPSRSSVTLNNTVLALPTNNIDP